MNMNEEQQIKQMREIQLQLSDAVIDFCKCNNLKVWAGYGTLLGAVRHKGFIPWDDDVDFMMLREDFDRLRALANAKALPDPLSFDCSRVDVIKVKNNNTTQIAISKISKKNNYGIWVDIWCLDSMPNNISQKDYSFIRNKLRIVTNEDQVSFSAIHSLTSFIYHSFCLVYTHLLGKENIFNSIESKIKNLKGDQLVNMILFRLKKDESSYETIKKYDLKWFQNTVELPFEDRFFPCPVAYHEILTAQYGDYMIPVKGAESHNTSILKVDRPYAEVVEEILSSLPLYKRILIQI